MSGTRMFYLCLIFARVNVTSKCILDYSNFVCVQWLHYGIIYKYIIQNSITDNTIDIFIALFHRDMIVSKDMAN